jgi:CSLREA domain-containing protein
MVRVVRRTLLIGILLVVGGSLAEQWTAPAHALSIFTVNDTGDAVDAAPGDGTCATAGAVCTLRAAIQEANALAGGDVIEFSIGAGTPAIQPLTALPTITEAVLIQGNTGGATRIDLDGTLVPASPSTSGLRLATTGSNVNHMIVRRFVGYGVYIEGGGSNELTDSYIGTDPTGSFPSPNGALTRGSVYVTSASNTIRNNLISGSPTNVRIEGASAISNTLEGNTIGLDSAQSAVVPSTVGVFITGNSNIIGTTNPGGGNVISGHGAYGILILGDNNVVGANVIGSNAALTTDFGNGSPGVAITTSGSGNVIGQPGAGNNISGNDFAGLIIEGPGNAVSSNVIGGTPDGFGGYNPLPNSGPGIRAAGGSVVGLSISSNVIAYNSAEGIIVNTGTSSSPTGVNISQNAIFDNGTLGIDLSGTTTGDGVTGNDPLDADAGPNNQLNHPVLTFATTDGPNLWVGGMLSTTPSSGTYVIDIFVTIPCDASNHGEGRLPIATAAGVADAQGIVLFSSAGPNPGAPPGFPITATARSFTSGDTSEFSPCFTLGSGSCAGGDADCDGFTDTAPSIHQAPANTNAAFDNCVGWHNPSQVNLDGNFFDTTPPLTQDDTSRPQSDAQGDACDTDDDNDGLADTYVQALTLISGTNGAGAPGAACAADPLVFLAPPPAASAIVTAGFGAAPCQLGDSLGSTTSQEVSTSNTNDIQADFYATFTLPAGYTSPSLNIQVKVDDVGRIYLNGNLLAEICKAPLGPATVYTISTTNAAYFVTGVNLFRVEVVNNPASCDFIATARVDGFDTLNAEFEGTVSFIRGGEGCATGFTASANPDTDGDGYLDGAECAIGTNPNLITSKPTADQCRILAGAATVPTDTDGDLVQDRIEVCGHNTSTTATDSDADGRPDKCEVASLNTLAPVNSLDQLLLAQAIIIDLGGPFVYNADLNKDGANNSADQLLMAQILLSGGC